MEYSKYQTNIFSWVAEGKGNGQIIAPAGSGKTFTGVESVRHITRGMVKPEIVYLAFNKHIQEELSLKLPDYATGRTYHSFGLATMQGMRMQVSQFKNNDLLQSYYGKTLSYLFPLISRIVGLFKSNLLSEVTPQTVMDVIDNYGLDLDEESEHYFDTIVEGVRYCLEPDHITRLKRIDYDDMIWYPVIWQLPISGYDYIFVDEAQDSNPAQTELIIRARNSHGRVITIGDPNQAIYGWRGAGIDSMDILQNKLNSQVLPLSITYRCPKAVVELVNATFPDIPFELWEGAQEGSVNEVKENDLYKGVQPGDMVLCRINAPLVSPAMHLLRNGIKAIIKGKDIGKNLIQLIHKVEHLFHPSDINEFLVDLDDYCAKESMRLRETGRHGQADLLSDKQETIYAFADGMDTISDMKHAIESIFADDVQGVVFSSVHRAKGLESDNVYILKPELLPFKRAKLDWQKKQERNLQYVAYTRAKRTLNFVS